MATVRNSWDFIWQV